MGSPYIGEIRLFAGNFPPAGWAFCQGQLLPITENDTLFTLIGTTYGGDGQTTFALPNLAGIVPIGFNAQYTLGETGGAPNVTLTVSEIPSHTHPLLASANDASGSAPAGDVPAVATAPLKPYVTGPPSSGAALASASIVPVGGFQPHENMQPYQVLNYIISLFGIFPSQT